MTKKKALKKRTIKKSRTKALPAPAVLTRDEMLTMLFEIGQASWLMHMAISRLPASYKIKLMPATRQEGLRPIISGCCNIT